MSLFQSLRHAWRASIRAPGATSLTIGMLALGIGASMAIFSVVNTALLQPLPYPDAHRLVQVVRSFPDEQWPTVSIPKFVYWREHNEVFDRLALYDLFGAGFNLTGGDRPVRIAGSRVSSDFFAVFDVAPALGRDFRPDEERPGAPKVAILSDALWHRLGGRPEIVGEDLTLNDAPVRVVGVMPPGFVFPPRTQLWTPLTIDPNNRNMAKPYVAVGRLGAGVELEAARASVALLRDRHRAADPSLVGANEAIELVPLQTHLFGPLRPALFVLLAAVGVVLAMACVNVANLQLARASARRRELAVRVALGASPASLARQLIAESMLLALVGGLTGLLVATWGVQSLVALGPTRLRELPPIGVDATVLLVTLVVSVLSGALFGLIQAFGATRLAQNDPLTSGGHRATSGPTEQRARSTLAACEVALAMLLLVGAVLLIRSFVDLRSTSPGFEADRVLTLKLPLSPARFEEVGALVRFNQQLLDRLEALPGVTAAAAVTSLPLAEAVDLPFAIEGRYRHDESTTGVGDSQYRATTPRFFESMGIRLLRGRGFTRADGAEASGVAVVNATAARRYWPDGDVLGARITMGLPYVPELADRAPRQIIGVVSDVHEMGLDEDPPATVYVPIAQLPPALAKLIIRTLPQSVVIRSELDPADLAAAARAEIERLAPDQPITDVAPMTDVVARSIGSARFNSLLVGLLAGIALVLAGGGIFGVLSHAVSQRTREIGVRVALGASHRAVLGLVARQGLPPVLAGIALGGGTALLATRALRGLLFGIGPLDPISFVVAPLVLFGIAGVSMWLPAPRAARIDPVRALRTD